MPQGFTLPQVKFIAAQLVIAFECLHSNGLAHRDLKPENVLIDQEGYIRLADFGLAKDLNEGVGKGSCGTLEYMAPEIIEATEKGHKYEVDWWTLGVLMYELYYGVTPFLAGSRKEIMENITSKDPEFPKKAGETSEKSFKNFKKIVTKFLHKNPEKRLGHSKKGEGAKKVKKQSFFKNVDWSNILTKEYEAPYVPKLNLKKLEKYLEEEG
jgi:serine/threonine protein kinase